MSRKAVDRVNLAESLIGRVPKYLTIARELRRDIGTRYQVGDYFPSERVLQKAFSATPKTIRSALDVLSKEGLVKTEPYKGTVILDRGTVMPDGLPKADSQAVEDKAIGPDRSAGKTDRSVSKTIALILPLDDFLVAQLARGVERELRRHGYRLQLSGTYAASQAGRDLGAARVYEQRVLESLADDSIAGAIWWSEFGPQNRDYARVLQDQGIPLVLVDNPVPGLRCDTIRVDDRGSAYRAASHLIGKGHTNIGYWGFSLANYVNQNVVERLAGYLDAIGQADILDADDYKLKAFGSTGVDRNTLMESLSGKAARNVYIYDEFSGEDKQGALDALMARVDRPTAFVVANDHVAYDFIDAIHAHGLKVPDDIALASFGDIDRNSRQQSVLTTIRQPFEEIGQRAVGVLLGRMKNPEMPLQHVHLPTELIVRQSSGPAGARAYGVSESLILST